MDEYESKVIDMWIADKCAVGVYRRTLSGTLFRSFSDWHHALDAGGMRWSHRRFAQVLDQHGSFPRWRSNGKRYFTGLSLVEGAR